MCIPIIKGKIRMDNKNLANKDPLKFLRVSREQRNRMFNIERQNAFRSFKSQAVVNVLKSIDTGTDLSMLRILPSYYEPLEGQVEDEFAESEIHSSLDHSLSSLKGELNSYRAGKIARELLGVNLDKSRLLKFAKSDDYVYGLSSKAVLKVAFENRLALKKLVIVEHHNLKVTQFPYLQGLYYRQESRFGADFDGLTADSDIFKDGFCHHY